MTPRETVLAWHEALNDGDLDRLLSLSAEDVEVGGPRGSDRGAALLADWLGRAHIRMQPRRIFERGEVLVVEQSAAWLGADGAPGEPQIVASVFRVEGDRVASVVRYSDTESALQAANLTTADLVA